MGFYTNKIKKSGDGLAITEWNDLSSAVAGNSGLKLAINPADKVGIGTESPQYPSQKLEVEGSGIFSGKKPVLYFNDTNKGVFYSAKERGDGFEKWIDDGPKDGLVVFGFTDFGLGTTSGGRKITLYGNSSGNIGIGTNDPSTKLEVSGDVKATRFIGEFVGNGVVPVGAILAYGGDIAPQGWLLCDGQTNLSSDPKYANLKQVVGDFTPDLQDRFIFGAGTQPLKSIGGAETHQLTEHEMPSHSHGTNDPGHSHSFRGPKRSAGYEGSSDFTLELPADSQMTQRAQTGITINRAGGNGHHNNMPPYYVLTYIIKY